MVCTIPDLNINSITCYVSMNCAVVVPGDADSATNLPSS